MKIAISCIILLMVVATSGCVMHDQPIETSRLQFAEKVNASQAEFDRMVEDDPYNASVWCLRGIYYNDAFNQYDKALNNYDRGLELDPNKGICWYAKGVTLKNLQRYNESAACFKIASEIDPTFSFT